MFNILTKCHKLKLYSLAARRPAFFFGGGHDSHHGEHHGEHHEIDR